MWRFKWNHIRETEVAMTMMNIRYVRCIMYTSTYVECCWTIAKSNRKKNIISSFVRAFGRDIYPPTAQSVISEALAGHLLKLSTPSVAVEGLETRSRSISNYPRGLTLLYHSPWDTCTTNYDLIMRNSLQYHILWHPRGPFKVLRKDRLETNRLTSHTKSDLLMAAYLSLLMFWYLRLAIS